MRERWTWDGSANLNLESVFAGPALNSTWCDGLDRGGVTGKVLCACAALAVARAVARASGDDPTAGEALDLLAAWIDDPTDERFDRIGDAIFGPGERPGLGPHGVAWWALRTATGSVGNGEAGWALGGACDAAVRAGFALEVVRSMAEREVLARRRESKP